jgi:hypothetical protein
LSRAAAAAFTAAAARALFPFFDSDSYQEENHRDHRKQQHDGCDIICDPSKHPISPFLG